MQVTNRLVNTEANQHNIRPRLARSAVEAIASKLGQRWDTDAITAWFKDQFPGTPYADRVNTQRVVSKLKQQ